MARKRWVGVICVSRESGPQCGYVGYNEDYEAWKNGVPTHKCRDDDGRSRAGWGPLELCRRQERNDRAEAHKEEA